MRLSVLSFVCVLLFGGGLFAQNYNLLENADLEMMKPNYWSEWNQQSGVAMVWATDETYAGSERSFKIEKSAATGDWVGWQSENNADLYWNNAAASLYNFSFQAKTMGVNTAPANEDAQIGVWYKFYAGGSLVGEKFVAVDQSSAETDWTEYNDLLQLTGEPDEVLVYAAMGKDATGTVWFDNINAGTTPDWSMGVFNADAETPEGWMNWTSGSDIGFANLVEVENAPSGSHVVLLAEKDELGDEMVFYSEPVVAKPNAWYALSAWIKSDSVNTDSVYYYPTNVVTDRIEDRIAVNFFFHRGDIAKSWDLTGGDQFFYIDQRNSSQEWTQYSVIAQAPEDAAGVSMRARFNPTTTGYVWYDDFAIYELADAPNLLGNADLEMMKPNYWSEWNQQSGVAMVWATDETYAGSERSFKIEKSAATGDWVGWQSENNADLYWNNAAASLYNFSFQAKTMGVNTAPANEDAQIGVWYKFYAGGSLVGEKFVAVDQSSAETGWTEYNDLLQLTGEPDEVLVYAAMGKDATGTVWFDNINAGTTPDWSMGVFNADAETPEGWMNWTSGSDIGFANLVEVENAPSGSHVVLLAEKDELGDEMVFYSEPVAAEPLKWYKISAWIKSDSVNTDSVYYYPTNVVSDRIEDRIAVNFFFHRGDIAKSWDLTGGDQFFYIDQRDDIGEWTRYSVIAQAPEDAAGVSMRARFNPTTTGYVWYDDFSISELQFVVVGIEAEPTPISTIATDFRLMQNYPNPFNPETVIEYMVPEHGAVGLNVYNMLGQKIRTLVNQVQTPGTYRVLWDGRDEQGNLAATGVYIYQLRGENALITKKMVLIK